MAAGEQRQEWEELSALDPYWAILSDRDRRFGGWDRAAFLSSGRAEIDALLREGSRFGVPAARGAALDFGCGAGRLTLAIAAEFERCLGLDVSERMIAEARELGSGARNCEFAVHDATSLAGVQSAGFDLVVCRLVLQHVPGGAARARYVAELVRVLRPGGLLALQLPSHIPARHRVQPRPRLYRLLRRAGVSSERLYRQLHLHPIRMGALARTRVVGAIEAGGGRVLDVREERVEGGVTSGDYLVTKPA